MPCTLNKEAWERLINEDIEWLDFQPDTLECKHIREILEWVKTHRPDKQAERIKELEAENKKMKTLKCPPIDSGDTCICPIEELESMLIKRDERIKELEAENKQLKRALEHIIEYWNKDENPGAMSDALWHILETAEQARKG